jgi:hypothetical protein
MLKRRRVEVEEDRTLLVQVDELMYLRAVQGGNIPLDETVITLETKGAVSRVGKKAFQNLAPDYPDDAATPLVVVDRAGLPLRETDDDDLDNAVPVDGDTGIGRAVESDRKVALHRIADRKRPEIGERIGWLIHGSSAFAGRSEATEEL